MAYRDVLESREYLPTEILDAATEAAAGSRQMNPPPKEIRAAIEAAKLSLCQSKRGASIWNEYGHVASGYNHKPKGFVCDGSDACKRNCAQDAVHAEQHAIILAGHNCEGSEMLHVKVVDGELVYSGPPSCLQCSKLIIQAGIAGMWLFHPDGWRRYTPQEFHWYSGAYLPSNERKT